jgi:hypothetical protein
VQATQYRDAMALAFCQPTGASLFVFHVVDEADLESGVYYADGKPKTSLPTVRAAANRVHRGVIARCAGMQLVPRPVVVFPTGADLRAPQPAISLTCDIDCNYLARLERLPTHATVAETHGAAIGRFGKRILLPPVRPAPDRYRLTLRLAAPVNPGPPAIRVSPAFTVARSS